MTTTPASFRRKPTIVAAVRYGKDVDGAWYPGAVDRVALFMAGRRSDETISEPEVMLHVQPSAVWEPPEHAALLMHDSNAHNAWLPLALGDWVIRGVKGEFYPCKPDVFDATYEAVE